MLDQNIYVKKYIKTNETPDILPVNEKEIWRYCGYMGIPKDDQIGLLSLLNEVYKDLENAFSYKLCYRRLQITWQDDMPVLPFYSQSQNLARCLTGSDEIVMFAATIGTEIDRLISLNQRFNPTKALIMQAYGAERVEALCDEFCRELKLQYSKEGFDVTPRFSPGYGDLPLEVQKEFFTLLDINRKIGISLGDSMLMRPSKSVTAVFGLKPKGQGCESDKNINDTKTKCESCENINCSFR